MNTYLLSLKRKVSKETFSRVTVMISDTSETFVTRLVRFPLFSFQGRFLSRKERETKKLSECLGYCFGQEVKPHGSLRSLCPSLFKEGIYNNELRIGSFSSENFTSSLFIITYYLRNTLCFTGRPKWTRTTDLVLIRHAL